MKSQDLNIDIFSLFKNIIEKNIYDIVSKSDRLLKYVKDNFDIEPSLLDDEQKYKLLAIAYNNQINTITNVVDTSMNNKTKIALGVVAATGVAAALVPGALASIGIAASIGVNEIVKMFYDVDIMNDGIGKITGQGGGGKGKCYTVSNLKQILLKQLVKITDNVNLDEHIPSGEPNTCDIDMKGKPYLLNIDEGKKIEKIIDNTVIDNKKNMDVVKDINKKIINSVDKNSVMKISECVKKTNLIKINKKIDETIWETIDKKFKNIEITPTSINILGGSVLIDVYSQIGGDAIKNNIEFSNDKQLDIDIEYSYDITKLLQKAILYLNNNKIYLDEKTILDIRRRIKLINSAEYKLSEYAINIIKASELNFINDDKKILNENTLKEYIKKHNNLLIETNRNSLTLNKCILKLYNLIV